MLLSNVELISVCEHIRYSISTTRTYYENYLAQLSKRETLVVRRVVDNLGYILMVLSKVEKDLCSNSPNAFAAYNELDKLYTRVISNQFVPGVIRASIYEVHHELKNILYGNQDKFL